MHADTLRKTNEIFTIMKNFCQLGSRIKIKNSLENISALPLTGNPSSDNISASALKFELNFTHGIDSSAYILVQFRWGPKPLHDGKAKFRNERLLMFHFFPTKYTWFDTFECCQDLEWIYRMFELYKKSISVAYNQGTATPTFVGADILACLACLKRGILKWLAEHESI